MDKSLHLAHLIHVLLLPCPLVRVVVPPPVLHLPLLHHYNVGTDSVQEVLRTTTNTKNNNSKYKKKRKHKRQQQQQ